MAQHEMPIEFNRGLVDPRVLLDYMDECHCPDHGSGSEPSHIEEGHHLYFPRSRYRRVTMDPVKRKLRHSRYNLVDMLSCQENAYHKDVWEEVPHEQIDLEAAETFTEEADWLTDYASTSWMLAATGSGFDYFSSPVVASSARQGALPEILGEMLDQDINQVGKIVVMDQAIVNGALSKYLAQQPEQGLRALLDEGLESDQAMLPPCIYGPHALRNLAEKRVKQKIDCMSWAIRVALGYTATSHPLALQTGVKPV